MSILNVFYQMLILFAFILIGVVCFKKGIVNGQSDKAISQLIVHVFNPALIFSGVLSRSDSISKASLNTMLAVAVGVYVALVIISKIIAKIFARDDDEYKIYQLMTIFSNIGFIGIPLVKTFFGPEPVIYVALFLLTYNILVYTYGISILQKDKFSIKQLRKIINLGTIASFAALFVFLNDIAIPSGIETAVGYLADATTPLAMMAIGFSLAKVPFMQMLNGRLVIYSVVKLIAVPIVGLFILKGIGLQGDMLGVTMIMIATPIGNMPALLATEYDVASSTCAQGIIITTILSIFTMPFILGLL